MKKVHIPSLPEDQQRSPSGKFQSFCKNISVALGARRRVNEPGDAHPFDVQIRRIPPGASVCPYHAHAAQWELFVIVSGQASVRREGETHTVTAGDAFVHPPGTPHQITNASPSEDLLVYIVADNPPVDVFHYPDSKKYGVRPMGKYFRIEEVDYFDGEDARD
ncbi:MAG: cupin domain-containing protein [Opitutus sp.]